MMGSKGWTKLKNPETSRIYRREVVEVLQDFAPAVYPCVVCHHPVVNGFCCTTCGSSEPEGYFKKENGDG